MSTKLRPCARKGCTKPVTRKNRLFCSHECYRLHTKKTYTCSVCGGERNRQSKTGICRGCMETQNLHPGPPSPSGQPPSETVSVNGDTCEVTRTTEQRVRTLADLIRVCEIDTKEWEVERWVANKWEVGAKDAAKEIRIKPLFQIKAWLRRRTPLILTMEALRTALVQDIRDELARKPHRFVRRFVETDWLFEFAPTDLHMGKYSWGEETVSDYDIDIAGDLFSASLDFLLEKALRLAGGTLSRVLCLFGNDVSHMDSKRGETTSGTRMDVDTRYIKVYRRICEIHRRAVSRCLEVGPVDVIVVPGNHDELTSFHLGEILAATYEGHKRVTVNNSPKLRKYYDFGINLWGFTHGDAERVAELPLTMAREVPDLWAKCTSREWHIGHLHKGESWQVGRVKPDRSDRPGKIDQDLYSDKGVRIRRLASLSSHDAWHTKHAYMDRRTAEGFVFHRTAGFTADLSFNVDHFSGKALTT